MRAPRPQRLRRRWVGGRLVGVVALVVGVIGGAGIAGAMASLPATAAQVGCTPTAGFTQCAEFTFSGADQTFTLPAAADHSSVFVEAWGAGGGGTPDDAQSRAQGGGGGFASGRLNLTGVASLTVIVGGGGIQGNGGNGSLLQTGAQNPTYGGGGPSQFDGTVVGWTGASGGGRSAVRVPLPGNTSASNEVLTAGGGGGVDDGTENVTEQAGAGGGTAGQDGSCSNPICTAGVGSGGTQTAGGAAGSNAIETTLATAGSQFQGGAGGCGPSAGALECGGGGGGGYFGGGGGGEVSGPFDAPAGGGSSHVDPVVTGGTTMAGADATPANTSDPEYLAGIGKGGDANGGPGLVVIQFNLLTIDLSVAKAQSPSPYVPGRALTYTVTVANAGPSNATGVTVADPLPSALGAGFTWTCTPSTGATCAASGTGDIHDTATIPSGGRIVYTLTGTVPAGTTGTLNNTATVTPPPTVTDTGCTPSCTATSLDPEAEPAVSLAETATVSPAADQNGAKVGDSIAYTFTVTNSGAIILAKVAVNDPVVGSVTCPAPAAPGLAPGASVTCTGDAAHMVVQADVTAGKVSDMATATGTDSQGRTSPASEPSTATVVVVDAAVVVAPDDTGSEEASTEADHPAEIISDLISPTAQPTETHKVSFPWSLGGAGLVVLIGLVGVAAAWGKRRHRQTLGAALVVAVVATLVGGGSASDGRSVTRGQDVGAIAQARPPAFVPSSLAAGRPSVATQSTIGALAGPPTRPALLISRLAVQAAVVPEGIDRTVGNAGNLAIPSDVREVGWWNGGPVPGQAGTAVLAAHRAEGGAFWNLPSLRAGDAIETTGADGRTIAWTVTSVQQSLKADLPESLWNDRGPPRLALVTCGGVFNPSIGHYDDNVIVWAVPTTI